MLNFETSWRFNSPGPVDRQVVNNFYDFIAKIARSEQGIRHGMHLKEGVATTPEEARYYCDFIVTTISFLLAEYEKNARAAK